VEKQTLKEVAQENEAKNVSRRKTCSHVSSKRRKILLKKGQGNCLKVGQPKTNRKTTGIPKLLLVVKSIRLEDQDQCPNGGGTGGGQGPDKSSWHFVPRAVAKQKVGFSHTEMIFQNTNRKKNAGGGGIEIEPK